MYIDGYNYFPNLKIYQNLRDYMIYSIYNRPEYLAEIMSIVASKIDCLDINYDSIRMEININIKKTTMRRTKGYAPSSMYYYGIMNAVFKEFFMKNPDIVKHVKQTTQIDLSTFNDNQFDNLCQINCIGDKAVIIKL